MPIDPNRPPQIDRVMAFQRRTWNDLPPADLVEAFVFAWVEQPSGPNPAGLWFNIVTTALGNHQWVWIGPGGGGAQLLPDPKFVVARTGYGGGTLGDVAPSTTYTDPDPAIAFNLALTAANAYRAVLQALPEFAGLEARCTVMLHPDHYVGTFSIPDGVTVVGLGATPADTMVDRLDFSLLPAASGAGARNLTTLGAGAPLIGISSLTGRGRLELERVVSASAAETRLLNRGGIVVRECVFGLATFGVSPGASLSVSSLRCQYARLRAYNATITSMEDNIVGIDDGQPDIVLDLTSGIIRDATVGSASFAAKPAHVLLGQGSSLTMQHVSLLGAISPGGSSVDGSGVGALSTLRVRDILAPSQLGLYGPSSRLLVTALGSHEAEWIDAVSGTVAAPGFLTLSTPGGTADIYEVSAVYQSPLDPLGTFALLPLPDARRLAPGRSFLIKNAADPSDPTYGSIALVTTAGQTIDYLSSSPTPVLVTSATHVILAPGDQVCLYVPASRDRFRIRGA